MELIYNNFDIAIIVACVGAIVLGAIVLGLVLFVFRQGEEVEEELEERKLGE